MPSLPELPNEILYKIIDQIHPDDIINFSLSLKHLHAVSRDAVSLHLQRKSIYEDVHLHGCYRHAPNSHPLVAIQHICMDWKIGEYPKSLTFKCCGRNPYNSGDEDDIEKEKEQYKVAKEEDDLLISTIMEEIQDYIQERAADLGVPKTSGLGPRDLRSEYESDLNPFNVEASFKKVIKGDRVAMLALLLLFIPNLKVIRFKSCTWGNDDLRHAIHWISEQNLQRSSNAPKPLMDLSQIRLLGRFDLWRGETFEAFMPFATLPSMRTIFGEYVEGLDRAEDKWKFPPHTSKVTEIVLQHSAIRAEYLDQLLIGIKALKRFTYNRHVYTKDPNELYQFCPVEIHQIIGVLLEHAKHSLEFLSLTGVCFLRARESDIHACKGSLRDFKVLKEVILDSNIYVERASYARQRFNPNEITYVGKGYHISRHLVDVLPPSIETVMLIGNEMADHAPGLLVNFVEQKELRLPKLSKLFIGRDRRYPNDDWVRPLWEKCRKVGVVVKIAIPKDAASYGIAW